MDRDAVAFLVGADELDLRAIPDGVELVHTVHATGHDDRVSLGEALGWIDSGRARVLLVSRLGSAAASLGELVRVLDWLAERQAGLIALDLGLDTDERAGRMAVDVVRELQRWAREPKHPRQPSGRPGLVRAAPDLAERIGEMRRRGLSLQAIAQALNDQGIPTPRGGAEWRPSSVQTALGYRRPHPPAPPHRPERPGPPGPGGHPGRGPKGRP